MSPNVSKMSPKCLENVSKCLDRDISPFRLHQSLITNVTPGSLANNGWNHVLNMGITYIYDISNIETSSNMPLYLDSHTNNEKVLSELLKNIVINTIDFFFIGKCLTYSFSLLSFLLPKSQ